MVERDGNIPEWNELEQELFMITKFRQETSHSKKTEALHSKGDIGRESPQLSL